MSNKHGTSYALSTILLFIGCALAGGAAGIATDMFFYPVETFKTYIQANQVSVKSMERFRKGRLYAGISCSFIVSFPTSSAFFLLYEFFSTRLLNYCIIPFINSQK